MGMQEVFSIGYAQYTRDHLLERLRQFGVTAIADIRTYRSSSYWTAFDSESFGPFLRAHGIAYVFLGDQLGGKPQIEALYPDERLDYERLARQNFFQAGLDRVENGAGKFTLCLMCAEKDPLESGRSLRELGFRATRRGRPVGLLSCCAALVDHKWWSLLPNVPL